MGTENTERKALSVRQYIGAILPSEPKRDPGDIRPLTLKEYMAVRPIPNIDDLMAMIRGAKRFIARKLGR